jgi:hypothetical protein
MTESECCPRDLPASLRSQSEVPARLEQSGKITIDGSMYHLVGGRAHFPG